MKRLFTVGILAAVVVAGVLSTTYFGTRNTHETLPDSPIVVAVIDQYPPFSYVAENGERMGYDFDLGHDICRMMKVRCVFKPFPLGDIRALLEDNKVDVAIAGLRASPERMRTFAFSDAYYRSLPFFITNHSSLIPFIEQDPRRLVIGVMEKSMQYKRLMSDYAEAGIKIKTYAKYEDIPKALHEGDINMMFTDGLSGYALLKSPLGRDLRIAGNYPFVDSALTDSRIAVSIEHKDWIDRINLALIRLQASGRYQELSLKYFPYINY